MLATGHNLCPPINRISNFRQEIFKTLAGNCLKSEREKDCCFLCDKAEHYDWIACTRCDQSMHCFCAKTTKEEGDKTTISLVLLKHKKN